MSKSTIQNPKETSHQSLSTQERAEAHQKDQKRRDAMSKSHTSHSQSTHNGHAHASHHHAGPISGAWDNIREKGSEFGHTIKDKSSHFADNVKKNPAAKELLTYARNNKKEAFIGGLLILGLICSFYWLGSFIVGLAAGLYAPWTLKNLWNKGLEFRRREGKFASFVVAVGIVYMLLHVFSFVIGGIAGVALRSITSSQELGGIGVKRDTDTEMKRKNK